MDHSSSTGDARRRFLKKAAGGSAALAAALATGAGIASCDLVGEIFEEAMHEHARSRFDPRGLPTRTLGSTGDAIPLVAVGTGNRFMELQNEEEADRLLQAALDAGLFYWDTAAAYGNDRISSEERLGRAMKGRRNEVFLSTKVQERSADDALRTVERSLNRLGTDFLDLCHVHSIDSLEDAQHLGRPGGVLEALHQLKSERVVRHIGFSGHTTAEGMAYAARNYDFDAMLIALNHYASGRQPFEESAVPVATSRGMGVLVMKVIRPREADPSLQADELIRYALTLPGVSAAVIGIDGMEVLQATLETARTFVPLSDDRMTELRAKMAPFFEGNHVPWMRADYRDEARF